MSRILVILIAAVSIAGAVLWIVTGERTSLRSSAGSAPATEPTSPPSPVDSPLTPAEDTDLAEPVDEAVPERSSRESASAREIELARASWVTGRVIFPPGTPADEQVFVVGDGYKQRQDHRAEVASDGSFRLPFAEKTSAGHIGLRARYLYLDEGVPWRKGEATEVVLEPKLGTRITGRLRLPPGANAGEVRGMVFLHTRRQDESSPSESGGYPLTQDLAFACDALVPGARGGTTYELGYEGSSFIGQSGTLLPEAGRTLEVVLPLRRGVVLGGVVRDESGAPLPGVQVEVSDRPNALFFVETGNDGSFRLIALESGKVRLEAKLEGFLPLMRDLGRLEEGTSILDLELVLSRGQSISGTVRWPDGSPAQATVQLSPLHADVSAEGVSGRSDARGSFSIGGLPRQTYQVTARATKAVEVELGSETIGRRPEILRGIAAVDSVLAGTSGLELTLSTGLELTGRVVDDLGAAVADYQITARRSDGGGSGQRSVRQRLHRTDGSFVLHGFAPGEWKLEASSSHHAESEPLAVTLPALAPVVLVVPREAVITGRVLDSCGAPVAKASVVATYEPARPYATREKRRTDEHGVFQVDELAPGTIVLRASGANGAPSDPVSVQVVAGETVADVVLRLQLGARLVGELLGADGRPESGDVLLRTQSYQRSLTTDADGRFESTGIPPGELSIDARFHQGFRLAKRVTVVASQTTHVRLQLSGGMLEGRVRMSDGSAASGVAVSTAQGRTLTWSDGTGAFRASGVEAGTYQLVASQQGFASEPVRVDIVAGETERIEFVLAPASCVHFVARLGGVRVGCEIELVDARGRLWSVGEVGETDLGPLVAGTYTLRATFEGKSVERRFDVSPGEKQRELELVFD